jgi:hypothetical protein
MSIKEQVLSYERELLLAAMDAVGFLDAEGTLEDVAMALCCNREHVKYLQRKHNLTSLKRGPETPSERISGKLRCWK